MFDLTGKTALVTGASGGIGQAIAEALHMQGATVGLCGRNADKLSVLAEKLGSRAHVFVKDLAMPEAPEALVRDAEEKMGGIDILVNNAGFTKDGLFMRMKDADWQEVQDMDLFVPFKLTRAAIKGMMKKRFGRVINITSVVGVTGNPGQANYCAAKAGMIGMTKAMAAEVANRGITLNCVAPGFIATAMTEALTDAQKEKINATIPAGAMGKAEDIAAACVYLASNEAQYVTGQTLHVNGGMAMI
ncbi:MAG: 3-oxoacyl-[acyl-carrier-protein] reductase [Alphaproteobacteria bacterium]|nr:3-oxoacyl-[acyl-carrier-protein] reductase [Alphaproteobacteria bacterium]